MALSHPVNRPIRNTLFPSFSEKAKISNLSRVGVKNSNLSLTEKVLKWNVLVSLWLSYCPKQNKKYSQFEKCHSLFH